MWNFFRLENEHLNNCGEFRAVRDISIAPIENSRNDPNKIEANPNLKYRKPKSKSKLLLMKKAYSNSDSGQYLKVKPNQSSASLRSAQVLNSIPNKVLTFVSLFSTNSSLSNRGNCEVSLIMDDNCELNRL